MEDFTRIDYAHIHPTSIIFTKQIIKDHPKYYPKFQSISNLQRNTYTNHLSQSSTSKCKRAINYLLINSTSKHNYQKLNFYDLKFKIAFITLTLPSLQKHTDIQIKRDCLTPFLIQANRLWDVNNYVWRSERQSNGNIHFHILVDQFCPHQEVRGLWNRLIAKLDYIKNYRINMQEYHQKGFRVRKELLNKWSYINQIKAYKNGIRTNWSSPNTTDIHSIKFVSNVAAYVTKYMTKISSVNKIKISAKKTGYIKKHIESTHSLSSNVLKYLSSQAQVGRLWACSVQLSNLKGGLTEIDSSINNEIEILKNDKRCKLINDNYCSILLYNIEIAIELKCINIVTLLSEFICERFVLNDESQASGSD